MALNENRDIAKYRSELKKVAKKLKRIHRVMSQTINDGYSAMNGRRNAGYYQRIVEDAREGFNSIAPQNYDKILTR